ncbi:MAG: hypothetical protein EAZ32_14760 [Cytophagia bacterium]|nr:MAG: hypothetical protein EAZ38_15840 [Cytophagales bacterium]TAG37638.1 MAG: hypothetical protein EAZ32_14760 [Cytophagia bacterium]TAG78774.1 MAG: hypothetical protein EAZ22_12905 [Cytophagales bacterium]
MGTWLVFRASYSNELSGVMVKDTIKPARFCQAGFMLFFSIFKSTFNKKIDSYDNRRNQYN